MSIIYDALKKVELRFREIEHVHSRAKTEEKQKSQPKTYWVYPLVIIFGFLGASLLYNLFSPPAATDYKTPLASKLIAQKQVQQVNSSAPAAVLEAPKEAALPERAASSGPVLNGIFFSQDSGYALINNQIVKEGDLVDGLLVKKIDSDGVELKGEDSIIRLQAKLR